MMPNDLRRVFARKRTFAPLTLAVCLAVLLMHCKKRKSRPGDTARRPASVILGEDVLTALKAFPKTVPFLVVIRPDRLNASRKTLRSIAKRLPPGPWRTALKTEYLVPILAAPLIAPPPGTAQNWGWNLLDRTRPILAAPVDADMTRIRVYLDAGAGPPLSLVPPTVHVRITLPAHKPADLAAALARFARHYGARPWAEGETLAGLRGGKAFRVKKMFLGIVPARQFVRVELGFPVGAADHARAARSFAHMARRALAGTPRLSDRMTPALHHALTAPGLVSLYVKTEGWRRLAAITGLAQAASAMRTVSGRKRSWLWTKGGAIVASAWLYLDAHDAEFEDMSVAAFVKRSILLETVSSLTAKGQEVYRVGMQRIGRGFPRAKGPVYGRLDLRLNLESILRTARSPLNWLHCIGRAGNPEQLRRELYRVLIECGAFCTLDPLVRSPWGLARSLASLLEKTFGLHLPQAFPSSLTIVLKGLGRDRFGPVPKVVVALETPSIQVSIAWQQVLKNILKSARGVRPDFAVVKGKNKSCLFVGLNTGARSAFKGCTDAPKDRSPRVTEFMLDLKGLIMEAKPSPGSGATRILTALGRIRARSSVADGAVTSQVLFTLGTGTGFWPMPAVALTKKPLATPPEPWAALQCLTCARWAVYKGLKGAHNAEPHRLNEMMKGSLDAIRSRLNCARKDASLKEKANRVEAVAYSAWAEIAGSNWDFKAENDLLTKSCRLGLRKACTKQSQRLGIPSFRGSLELAELPDTVRLRRPAADATVTVTDKALQVQGYEIARVLPGPPRYLWARKAGGRRNIQKWLNANLYGRLTGKVPDADAHVMVAADGKTPYRVLKRLFRAAAKAGVPRVHMLLRAGDQQVGTLEFVLPQVSGRLARKKPAKPGRGIYLKVGQRNRVNVKGLGLDFTKDLKEARCIKTLCVTLAELRNVFDSATDRHKSAVGAVFMAADPAVTWVELVRILGIMFKSGLLDQQTRISLHRPPRR